MRSFILAAVVLAACSGAGDIIEPDAGATGSDAPDIAGTYEVVAGEGLDPVAPPWFAGALVITGSADALTWDFGEEMLGGAIDDTFAFDFEGTTSADPPVSVSGGGTAFLGAGVWNLDGDVAFDDGVSETGGAFTAIQELP